MPPIGSIYLSSRAGPLAKFYLEQTGHPYDWIGIVFQSTTPGFEGVYVYGLDASFLPGTDRIVVVNLAELTADPQIAEHIIIPLRPSKYSSAQIAVLKSLFKRYRRIGLELDRERSLNPSADPIPETVTAAELVGRILFQAGLIWDGHLGPINPVLYRRDCWFPIMEGEPDWGTALIRLSTPATKDEYGSTSPLSSNNPRKEIVWAPTLNLKALRPADFLEPGLLNLSWFGQARRLPCRNGPHSINRLELETIEEMINELDPFDDPIDQSIDGRLLARICQGFTELAKELHALARSTGCQVDETPVGDYDDDVEQRKVMIWQGGSAKCHLNLVLPSYMWGCCWNYTKGNLPEKLKPRLTKLKQRVQQLIKITPTYCQLMEPILHLSRQTELI